MRTINWISSHMYTAFAALWTMFAVWDITDGNVWLSTFTTGAAVFYTAGAIRETRRNRAAKKNTP